MKDQAAFESSLLVSIANKDSVFSEDLSLDLIFLSLNTLETIASALRCSVPLLSSGANKVNTRSTGCLSADSKSIGRSKLEKKPNILHVLELNSSEQAITKVNKLGLKPKLVNISGVKMTIRVKFPTSKGTIEIGEGLPTYLISEVGLNHNGSEELAKEMIYQSALSGATFVKFQKRTIDKVYTCLLYTSDAADE